LAKPAAEAPKESAAPQSGLAQRLAAARAHAKSMFAKPSDPFLAAVPKLALSSSSTASAPETIDLNPSASEEPASSAADR